MKQSLLKFLSFSFFVCSFILVNAAQITVSNDPNRVAQYTNAQSAIDDALDGDTLLIYGSPTTYGAITINQKSLVLIGEGYNPNLSLTTSFSTITLGRFDSNLSSSGTTLIGLNVTSRIIINADWSGSSSATRTLQDFDIIRCTTSEIDFLTDTNDETLSNVNVINCIITSRIDLGYVFNVNDELININISNCIFDGNMRITAELNRQDGVLSTFTDLSGVRFFNNLFIDGVNSGLLDGTVNLVFEDNIFFGHELYNGDYAQITWNNNLFYQTDQTPIGANDNVGSGNILNTDPLFTDYPASPTAFSYDHDYTLQNGSPALTASVNGDEIGIYGGSYPFEVGAQPPVPKIIEVTIQDGTSSVPQGGTINFNFKAESGN